MNDNDYNLTPNEDTESETEAAQGFDPAPASEKEAEPTATDSIAQESAGNTYGSYQNNAYQQHSQAQYGNSYSNPYGTYRDQRSEPQYSPYSNSGYYQQQYNQPQTNPSYNMSGDGKKKSSKKGFVGFLIAVLAVVVCVAVIMVSLGFSNYKKSPGKTETSDSGAPTLTIEESSGLSAASKSSAEIAEAAQKFNVGILLYGKTQSFFSYSTGNSLVGEGSGIIMGEDKSKTYTYIITCAHVISGVKTNGYKMTVQDCDSNTYDAELVGFDSKTDVGVIKIKKTGLTAAPFGDSSKLVIGQQVYAIGNPGGTEFFGSFTNGMISAIDRPISSESGYEMKCIQHTTPINSGNSGGALLNESGQVIGINSSKIVSTGYEGMAFSIPITEAKPIIDDIISNGYVTNRPKLGITYVPATTSRECSMVIALKNLPKGSLIIYSIGDDSSLKDSEAQPGDMIIAVNGEKLTDSDVLLDKIENGKVGETLKLTLCRINEDYSIKTFEVSAKLIEDKGQENQTEQQQTLPNPFEDFFN